MSGNVDTDVFQAQATVVQRGDDLRMRVASRQTHQDPGRKPFTKLTETQTMHSSVASARPHKGKTVSIAFYYIDRTNQRKQNPKQSFTFKHDSVWVTANVDSVKFSLKKFKAGKYLFQVHQTDDQHPAENYETPFLPLKDLVVYNSAKQTFEFVERVIWDEFVIKVDGTIEGQFGTKKDPRFVLLVTNMVVHPKHSLGEDESESDSSSDTSDDESDDDESEKRHKSASLGPVAGGRKTGGCHHGRAHGQCGICVVRSMEGSSSSSSPTKKRTTYRVKSGAR